MMRQLLGRSKMMPIASLVTSAASLSCYFQTRGTNSEDRFWLVSGLSILVMMPYTVYFLGPINSQFRFTNDDSQFEGNDAKWNALLSEWLFYHRPRVFVGIVLFGFSLWKFT